MKSAHLDNLNEPITLDVREPVEITVRGSGTTGYRWDVEADEDRVEVNHQFEPDTESFGGAGNESFVLKPLAAGELTVRFRLKAPWEDEPAEEHVVTLRGKG